MIGNQPARQSEGLVRWRHEGLQNMVFELQPEPTVGLNSYLLTCSPGKNKHHQID